MICVGMLVCALLLRIVSGGNGDSSDDSTPERQTEIQADTERQVETCRVN